jgi:RecB family endonuclease NucS
MALFAIQKTALTPVESVVFESEKKLQSLIEANLHSVFNCRRVATEFPTGHKHAGRIDTLALSEDNNPVIIEYKNKESRTSFVNRAQLPR